MNRELRILMLEDTPTDAELIEHELLKANIVFTSIRVETRDAFIRTLEEFRPDIVLSDYKLPDFDGMAALKIVQHDHPDVPVVMVTGALTDIEAVELIQAGAKDYVLKDRLARLAPAVRHALSKEQDIRARKQAETQLHKSEEKYRSLIQKVQTAIVLLDGQGRILISNPLAQQLLGLAADQFLSPSMVNPELHFLREDGSELPVAEYQISQVLSTRQPLRGHVMGIIHPNRDDIAWVLENAEPEYDDAGGIAFVIVSFVDITERKRIEDKLRKSRDELEGRVLERTSDLQSANTALLAEKVRQEELIRKLAKAHSQLLQSEKMASIGHLAAGVAHEINNPIGFVNSNLGTLKHYVADMFRALSAYEESEGEMTAETREVLAELKRQIDIVYLREDVGNLLSESMEGLQRVKRIVQDLKDFSHVGESEKQWANLEQGLDSTLNVVWNELKYKAEIVKEYGGIPQIECIPAQLNQVFMNLLMNAGQAIEDHGQITIRTGQEDENVWVEVEDTGNGIKPEHMERIFDPFFTTKPVGTGTGLGLSLSYGIVQKHGGRIEIKSELGKGSVFRVVLPRHAILDRASETRMEDPD